MEQGAKPNNVAPSDRLVIPSELPILPLMNTVIYPHMVAPLLVQRQKSLHCIDRVSLQEPKVVGLFAQKAASEEEPTGDSLHPVGTAGLLLQMLKMPDGGARVIVRGLQRVRIVSIVSESPCIIATRRPSDSVAFLIPRSEMTLFLKQRYRL